MSYISMRLCSFFFIVFSLCFSDSIIYLQVYSFFLLPVQSYFSAPLIKFLLCLLNLWNFHLVSSVNSNSLLIFFVWWDIVIIYSFTSLFMGFFNSLITFIMTALKGFSSKSSSFAFSQFLLAHCFLCSNHTFLFLCISFLCFSKHGSSAICAYVHLGQRWLRHSILSLTCLGQTALCIGAGWRKGGPNFSVTLVRNLASTTQRWK